MSDGVGISEENQKTLDEMGCQLGEENCPHVMFSRCPGCHREMYAPGVWSFSHGDGACSCGHVCTPTIYKPRD